MYVMITIIISVFIIVTGISAAFCICNYFDYKKEELPNIKKETECRKDIEIEKERTNQHAFDLQKEKERTEQAKIEERKLKLKAEYKEKHGSSLY